MMLAAPEDMRSNSSDTRLRDVMRTYPTGVSILTTPREGSSFMGMTISSLVSISLDPDIVAVSLRSNSRTARAVQLGGLFAVNILGRDQQNLARAFAGPGEPRPDLSAYETIGGVPVGLGNVGFVLCEALESWQIGDHDVVIGKVAVARAMPGESLVYVNGEYQSASRCGIIERKDEL